METEVAATDDGARLIATPGLQQLLDRFAQEHFLRFEERVANLFEFLTSNTIRSTDESFLGEEDLTAFIAEAVELPFLTNSHIGASAALFTRCQALGFQRAPGGHVPVAAQGPGLVLAHYDPYVPLPGCSHKENVQLVVCTWSAFQKLAELWDQQITSWRSRSTRPFNCPNTSSRRTICPTVRRTALIPRSLPTSSWTPRP